MRPVSVVLPVALLLLAPCSTAAQSVQTFPELPLRVNLGDKVRIEDPSGATRAGRVLRLTPEEIVVDTAAGEQRFTSATVREVALRRNSRRKGVLIGAGVGAVIGAVAGCAGPDREECADAPILLGALGAAVGLAAGALDRGATVVYRRTDAAAPPGQPPPPGPFDALALRVNLDDRIRVEDRLGVKATGRLTRLTGEELTLETDAGEKRFRSDDVRAVGARGHSLGKGALIGAAVLTVAALASPACRDNPDCSPVAAGAVGAGVGLAAGALVPRMRRVYSATTSQVTFAPVFSRRAFGVQAAVAW